MEYQNVSDYFICTVFVVKCISCQYFMQEHKDFIFLNCNYDKEEDSGRLEWYILFFSDFDKLSFHLFYQRNFYKWLEIRKIEVRKVRKVDSSIERIENCDASFVEHISNIKDSCLFLKVQK